MALKRYIGPDDVVSLTVAGTPIGTVQRGQAQFISDELAESVEWSSELWEDVAAAAEE